MAYSNPFWYHPYFKIFFLLCLISPKPASIGKILKILKIMVWGGQGCHSNCPVFLRFILASLKTITSATSWWGTCCKQSRAIGKENRKEHWGASCKGEMWQARGKRSRHLDFVLNPLSVCNAVQVHGVLQHVTVPDVTVDNVTWSVLQLRDPLRRVTLISYGRKTLSERGGQS